MYIILLSYNNNYDIVHVSDVNTKFSIICAVCMFAFLPVASVMTGALTESIIQYIFGI